MPRNKSVRKSAYRNARESRRDLEATLAAFQNELEQVKKKYFRRICIRVAKLHAATQAEPAGQRAGAR